MVGCRTIPHSGITYLGSGFNADTFTVSGITVYFTAHFSVVEILVQAGGDILPAPAVPDSTGVSTGINHVPALSSTVMREGRGAHFAYKARNFHYIYSLYIYIWDCI